MEEGDEWVLVRPPPEKDLWSPELMPSAAETKPLKLTFNSPAKYWSDAVPIGNGRLGAMVWGGVATERIQLNEDTLWTGIPGDYTNPDAPEALAEVRKLVDDSRYADATTAAVKLSGIISDVNYEASGWVAHQVSDLWAKTSPDRGEAVWALWPIGGAWLCTHLWEHYTYTMDKEFLKRTYPLLEGCVSFLLDWLIEGPGGFLETNPSTSPEHMFVAPDGRQASVSYSSTMDIAIIKEVFSEIISAAEVLGRKEDAIVNKVMEAQKRLLPTRIARDGSIMEWALDFEDPDVHHRHISHLFGLFPGHTITVDKTPDLCKAADYTIFKRGEEGPGWSTTWKIAWWARLHNSDHAYRMVKHLFDLVDPSREADFEGGLYSNLFTAHPPFQIDANFGFAAAVAEMLVQSTVKDLYLLPAVPMEKWANGCVKGLKARGGVTVNICWREGDVHEIGLWSQENECSRRLHYRGTVVTANLSSGKVYSFDRQLKCVRTCTMPVADFP